MSISLKNLIPQIFKNSYHWLKAVTAVVSTGSPARALTVIGVTGTDGKTTTSTMIYHLLHQAGIKVALISTVAAYIGDESIDTGFHVTSPDPLPLQRLLKRIKDLGFTHVVLEATSHGLDQHRLLGTNIRIGVLTNITHEHLDYHRTFDRYVMAKAKLFRQAKVAILNKQDKSFKLVKPLLPPETQVLAYSTKHLSGRLAQTIRRCFKQDYNQANAAAATMAAAYLGISDNLIIKGLKTFPGIPGRMQSIKNKYGFRTIVDFAHTPNALENALKSLRQTTTGKLIAVYGSAGLRDRDKRHLMGRIGSELADEVVFTAEDPRTESVWAIIDQMMSQVSQNLGHIHKIPDRQEAINFAVGLAQPGDTVAVFGKGHEQSMCFGKIEYPWSDKEALQKALKLL